MQLFQQSEATAAQRRLFFHAVDATDGIAAETGLTGVGRLSKNGATTAATTASLTEIDSTNMPGRYYIEFTATELDTVGIIEFRYKAAACAEVVARAQVVPFDPYDATRLGLTALPNANAEAAGGLYTRGTGAGQINQPANGQIDANSVAVSGTTQTAGDIMGSLGEENAAAAAGDPSTTESVMQYVKQLVNVLVGTTGVTTWATGAAPASGVSISEALRAVYDDTNSLDATKIPDTISLANINAEVVDVVNTDTITLPGQVAPPLAPTHRQAIGWLYKVLRNRTTQTSTQWTLYADNETTVDAKSTVSDDGTTAIKQEIVTGP